MAKLPLVLTIALFTLVWVSMPVFAARPAPSPSVLGNDISWPQCGRKLPSSQAFGIVGVNGGLANTDNPCLRDQLLWASKSSGALANQPKIQLYVNTANPGGLNTPSWPSSNIDPLGNNAPNPYGVCDHSDSLACAWQYGWNRALEDVHFRFKPAAQAAGFSYSPSSYRWWLDVETENTWKTDTFGQQSNVADLEGMVAYFNSVGASQIGFYSTGYQWGQVVGSAVTQSSNLNGLKSWLAGAKTQNGAKNNCSKPPLTTGGQVTLTQFVSGGYDYDYSCI